MYPINENNIWCDTPYFDTLPPTLRSLGQLKNQGWRRMRRHIRFPLKMSPYYYVFVFCDDLSMIN
jgi:hypothetical protein